MHGWPRDGEVRCAEAQEVLRILKRLLLLQVRYLRATLTQRRLLKYEVFAPLVEKPLFQREDLALELSSVSSLIPSKSPVS